MKILVVHASAGAGHQKAAEYTVNGLKKDAAHEVVLVDALDYTYPFFKDSYRGIYKFMITYTPWAWAFVFYLIDVPILVPLVRLIRRIHNTLHCGGVKRLMIEGNFDVIISTHFMPTEIGGYLKRTGKIKSKLITVVTDYDVHTIWLAKGVDEFCIASDWTKTKMEKLGIDSAKVHVTGIPVDDKFTQPRDIGALKAKLGLDPDAFTALIATGSFGIGPIEEIVKKLDGVQALVVSGHNKSLYERLSAENLPLVKVYGLVDNMDELMAVADCMVTKPGGLSVTEGLNSHLPLIFFNAIPGQETGNINVLKKHGIGLSGLTTDEMAAAVNDYRTHPEKHTQAVEKTKALARPDAVKEIIQLINN